MWLVSWGFVMEILYRPFLFKGLDVLSFNLWLWSWWSWASCRGLLSGRFCRFSFDFLRLFIWNNIFDILIIMSILFVLFWLLDLILINMNCFLLSFFKTDFLRSLIFLLIKTDRPTSIFFDYNSLRFLLDLFRFLVFSISIAENWLLSGRLNLFDLRNNRLCLFLSFNLENFGHFSL